MNKLRHLILIFVCLCSPALYAQSLLDELDAANTDTIYAEATFKAPRLINGQSIENAGKHGFNFMISHRFGNFNTGAQNFWGLDEGHIRIGLEYGLTNKIDIGIGRSKEQKLIDSYLKIKLLRQASGALTVPVSISLYTSMAVRTDNGNAFGRKYTLTNRLNFVNELLIARKCNHSLSLQVVPGFIHRNLTLQKTDENEVFYTGFGGRIKLTNRIAINAEYYYVLSANTARKYTNPLSIGFDIETGGHVFQLHLSNARAMHEKLMVAENPYSWLDGGFGFGFNIIRHFNFGKRN